MAQNIKLKRSALAGKVPTTSSVDLGELAINTYDGKVFFKKSGSVHSVETLVATNSTTTGSIILTQTGSFGELVTTQDANIGRDIYVTNDIIGNGDLDIAGTLTASIPQGYIWVGDGAGQTKLVATSSLVTGGSGTTFSGSSNVNNRVITATGTTPELFGEASLTFDGTTLVSPYFQGDGSGITNVIAQISEVATVTASFTNQLSTVVTHNFNSKNVIVSVYDTTDSQIIPDSVTLTDTNNVTITFAVNQSGYAVVAKGGHIVSGSGAGATTWDNITSKPAGIISGSAQITAFGFVSGSLIESSSYSVVADRAKTADIFQSNTNVDAYPLFANVVGASGVTILGDNDLTYNAFTNTLTVGVISATTYAGGVVSSSAQLTQLNASTASQQISIDALNTFTSSENTRNSALATYTASVDTKFTTLSNITASLLSFTSSQETKNTTLSNVTGSINTYTGSLKTAFTASGVDVTFNGNQIIRGALTVGTSSLGATENTLTLGPSPAGGTGEGGQIMLQASGGVYTSASMLDNYQNQTRLLRGTNAGSDAVVAAWNMGTKQMQIPAYNSTTAFTATTLVGLLGFDANGNILTTTTGSGGGGTPVTITNNTDNYIITATGTSNTINGESNLQFNGSTLSVTGNITATAITSSGAVIAQANNAMYFRGGDDAELWDINVANTVGVYGQQDATVASIKLGSGGGTISGKSGNIGVNNTNPTQGTIDIVGNVYATSFTGALASTNGVVSGSSQIIGILSSLNSYTSSQDTKNSTLATYTGSVDTKFTTLSNVTGSLITSASNTETKFAAIATITGSLITSASNTETKFAAVATVTGSLITSASNDATKFTSLATYTGSVDTKFTSIGNSTSSLNAFTASASSSIFHLNASSASQQVSIDALNTFSGSQLTRNSSLATITGSLITSASNTETKFAAVATYTGSVDTKFTAVGGSTSSLNSFTSSASSSIFHLNASSASQQISIDALNTFSGSEITKNTTLANVTGSLITSASNTETKFAAVATYTGSNNTKWTALESVSSSFARINVQNTFTANQIISGSLTVTQDLVVLGSSSITNVSSSTLNIGTNLITVAVNQPSVRFGGLAVIDSGSAGSSGSFLYDSVQDEFIFLHRGDGTNITSSHFVLGPETYNNLGNETYLTNNRVPKGTGKEHLNDSNITDNGSVVSINSNTQVTGSLLVSNGITGSIAATNGVVSGSSQIVGILSSLNSYTQSQDTKNLTLANTTGSLNSYTSSQDTKNSAVATYTGSIDTKFTTLSNVTASLNASTASLNSKTGSYATTGSNSFTGSQTITGSLVVSDFLTVNSSSTFNKTISVKGGIYFGEFGEDQLLTDSNNYYSVYIGTDFVLTGLGDANTAIGYGIDEGNNDRSVMIGYYAGNSNSTAGQSQRNIAIGEYAALPGYGSDNISIGAGSFAQLISGSRNIAIGKSSGVNLISGSYNTLIGNVEFAPTTNVSNNIILADGQGNIKYRWDTNQNNIYGNLYVSGAISGSGFSGSIAATNGVISGSSQITAFGFVSGSYETTGRGIISGSSQITPLLPTGTISGSSQVNGSLITTNTVTINGTSVALGGSATISAAVSETATVTASFTAQSSIAVTHNFNSKNILVSVYNTDDAQIIPSSVTLTNNNTATVTLSSEQSGYIVVAKGGHIVTGSITPDWAIITNKPSGLVSGSAQITALGFASGSTIHSGSTGNYQFNSIGVGTPGSAVAGEIRATGDIVAFYSSDKRLKENIVPIENALSKVESISGNRYNWKPGFETIHSHTGDDLGVIAQEVQSVLPEVVTERETGYLAVDYVKLVPVLIEAIKELSEKVKELQNK